MNDPFMIKKPWSDAPGMEEFYDSLDPMELKLGLFGGGGSGGNPGGGGPPNRTRAPSRNRSRNNNNNFGGDDGGSGGSYTPRPQNRPKQPTYKAKPKPAGYTFGGGQPQPGAAAGQEGTGYRPSVSPGMVSRSIGREGAFVRGADGTLRRSADFRRKEELYGQQGLRYDPTAFYATGIRGFGQGRQAVEQGRRIEAMSESGVPIDADFSVERQQYADAVGGGEVGVGEQGFGRRAMLGGEGEIAEDLSGAENYQTDMPAEVAGSDLEGDPGAPPITPQANVIPDVNYLVPTVEREGQAISFVPGEGNYANVATGPLSKNLTEEKSGFGSSIVVY
tara:strand:- start:293 stop:1294 length:1002 start_codon:yes stop_codon:yes gene_type:complete